MEKEERAAIQKIKMKRASKNNDQDEEFSQEDSDDAEIQEYKLRNRIPKNSWIIKPGENTNRGTGIDVCKSMQEVKSVVGRATKGDRTFIIQKYIDYPLLVHKRKFDLRCYGILTSVNGSLKGYFYEDGYVRTSCKEFNHDDVTDKFVHLTNDAIQVHADDYGKFESGNKMAFSDFSRVIQM